MWNYPEIETKEHKYRSIAAPNECYKDGRVQNFENLIKELAEHIYSHRPHHWKEIITRCIDCFNNKYEPKVTLFTEKDLTE